MITAFIVLQTLTHLDGHFRKTTGPGKHSVKLKFTSQFSHFFPFFTSWIISCKYVMHFCHFQSLIPVSHPTPSHSKIFLPVFKVSSVVPQMWHWAFLSPSHPPGRAFLCSAWLGCRLSLGSGAVTPRREPGPPKQGAYTKEPSS